LTAVHSSSPGRTLGDYFQVARRHRWLIAGCLLAGLAAGGVYSLLTPPQFQSRASVLVEPTGADEVAITQARNKTEINLDTEAQLVTSTEVAALVAERLPGHQSPSELTEQVSVKVPPNTSILNIGFNASDPVAARDGARTFAAAYLDHRAESARGRLNDQATAADSELTGLRSERDDLSEQLDQISRSDPRYRAIKTDRDNLDDEISELSKRTGELTAAIESVGAGKVVSEAELPASANTPHLLINLASGGVAGLLLGACVAVARQRFAVRVWHPYDLPRRCGVEVLAALPPRLHARTTDVFGAFGPAGRVFGKLRNEVVAALDAPDQVIVVAGIAPGSASGVVAANLGAALARSGDTTIAVATHPGGPVTLSSLLDVPAVPGLSDVFAERVDLPTTIHRAARQPLLDVIGPGGCASAGGPSRDTVSDVYTKLRERASYVVLDAAPMSVSAEAQLLAAHADAVILAVECGRDRAADVAEAVQAVRRIDVPLLGAVVLPKAPVPTTDPIPVPATESRQPARGRRRPAPRRNSRVDQPGPDDTPTETLPAIDDEAVPSVVSTDDR
jgi:capsular polysaccharide biosynthesis protein/Mrp family chromosome partitioning ATPase